MRSTLWLPLLFAGASQQVEFWTKSNTSSGGCSVSGCGTAGLCAYAPDAEMHWCCNQYETYCWGFAQECVGSTGSSSQLFCSSGSSTWCCNKQYETCTQKQGQINVCIASGFKNPVAESPVSIASGSTLTIVGSSTISSVSTTGKSSIPTTEKSSTEPTSASSPSPSSSSPSSSPSSSSTVASDTLLEPSNSNTNGPTSTTSSPPVSNTDEESSGISTGAAVGAGIGGVLGLLLIVGVAFIVGRKYGGKKESEDLKPPLSEQHSPPSYLQPPYQASYTDDMSERGGYSPQYMSEIGGGEVPRPIHELQTRPIHELHT